MAEIKLIILKSLLGLMGYSLFGYLLFVNIDNIKGWILMVIGSVFAIFKLGFFIRRQYQAIHKEQQEAEMRQLEIKSKQLDEKERQLKLLEQELSLRITGLTVEQRRKQ